MFLRTTLFAIALALTTFSTANANWSISTLTNHTNQVISVNYPVTAGGQRGYGVVTGGDAAVSIIGFGLVYFQDKGPNTKCPGAPYWWVSITYNGAEWGMFYDGNGSVAMTVNADGSLSFTPGPATQVVQGSGPPSCF